ncbi:MAG: mechanosensitive ion channel domain-containing protein [Pseudomonadota bacterium]
MNNEIYLIWQEIQTDLSTPAVLWQLVVIAIAVGTAKIFNGALKKYVMDHAPYHWKVAIESVNRVLFPLTSLIIVLIGQIILADWQHVSLLQLASRLFLAMMAIRLIVYFIRYLFSPGGWLKTLESVTAWSIWGLLALHLTGVLPQILQALAEIQFNIGKNPLNLLLVMQGLLTIVVTIFIALWVSRLFENKLMRTEQMNVNMRVVLTKLIRIVLLSIALLIALSAVGLDITLLSVFGGALGVGLGFGLQRIASNYVSGFILLLDKSMQIGDVVTIDDKHYGVISDLRTRYLVLKKLDGTQVIVPNETLIINPVINHSYAEHKARVQMAIQVSYDSPLEKAMQLIVDATKGQTRILKTPEPIVHIKGFGESGIDLMLSIWIPDPEEGSATLQSEIFLAIWRIFEANKISIPFPQREIRIVRDKP